MALEFVMPKLAMAMQQGTVMEWKLQEGDSVEKGQVAMVIETEKVTYDVEAPGNGLLHILIQPDTTVDVFTPVALIAENEAELTDLQGGKTVPTQAQAAEGAPAEQAPPAQTGKGKKAKVSPFAKKLAKKHNLDITQIVGTGPGGRIVKEDVLKALEAPAPAAAPPVSEPAPAAAPAWEGDVVDGKRVKAVLPVKGMRKAIAEHMVHSLSVSAQLSTMGEVDMSEMIRLRKSLIAKEEEIGVRIGFTDLILLAMVKAVQHVPIVNASFMGNEIKIWEDINVSVAVSLDRGEYESGLIAPVLKNCEGKSLTEISKGVKDLVRRTRNNELTADDLTGGTITLSSTGALSSGWSVSTPVLNQPQAIIVQPGGIFEKPVAVNGNVEVRPMMTLCITFDHRTMDGAPVGKFYAKLKDLLEQPEMLIL